jgi:hypothetical protein
MCVTIIKRSRDYIPTWHHLTDLHNLHSVVRGKHLICKYNFDKLHKNNNGGVAMSADDKNIMVSSRSSELSTININGVTTNAQTSLKKIETHANKIYYRGIPPPPQAAESLFCPP